VIDVEVAGRAGGFQHPGIDAGAAAERRQRLVIEERQELQLLGKPRHRPGQAAGPGRERREALLTVRAAVGAVDDVEDRFVSDAATQIEAIAAAAVVDAEVGRCARMLQQAFEQADRQILFFGESMAEEVRQGQRAQRADRVDEE